MLKLKFFKKLRNKNSELTALKELINLLPGHVYCYDKNGVFHACNDQQAKAFGFSKADELIGKNGYEMQESKNALEELKAINEKIYTTGRPVTIEETATYYNGQEIVFLSKKLPWRNTKGEIIGIIGISFDITERKKNERELLIYAQIINTLPGHIYWKDLNGIYLGSNLQQAESVGLIKSLDLIGKSDYDISPKKTADLVRKFDNDVIKTGKKFSCEEPVTFQGISSIMHSEKVPLRDENNNIIGVLGVSIDISEEKKLKKELEIAKNQAENILKNIINMMPGHVYWKDLDFKFQGCNQKQAESAGFNSPEQIIGKDDFQMPWKEDAAILRKTDREVINKNKFVSVEEPSLINGEEHIFLSQKVPLKDQHGMTIGILGISFDITDRKDKEKLEIEQEANKKIIEAREKYKSQAEKAAHDIRSPLAGLKMIIDGISPRSLAEKKRLDIKEALEEINIIASDLVDYDKHEANPDLYTKDKPQTTLVATLLSQLVSMKKIEYKNLSILLDTDFGDYDQLAFIKIEPTALKRSLSNIINNARDAFEGKEGNITLKLEASKTDVKIIIQDNGKGMPQAIIDKILNKDAITSGKSDGHGFGMAQVRETLERNDGKLDIKSTQNKGTSIILTFPRAQAPEWFINEINFGPEDIIIVVDDDNTMHKGWDERLKATLADNPKIRVEHFYEGEEAINFINDASSSDKAKIFLLSDFELLEQPFNGLDVIAKTEAGRSILVTSHYANPEIQKRAVILDTKIIPKQSAVDIPIKVVKNFDYSKIGNKPDTEGIDVLVVDDNLKFAKLLQMHFSGFDKAAECFYDPIKFLKLVKHYPKNIRICIDNNFEDGVATNGIEVAQKLHEMGYQHLYLLSGDVFQPGELPDYLIAIVKTDPDFVKKIFAD